MAVVGATKFDESITDYTGHQLWLVLWNLITIIVPGYVVINWITDMYYLFHENASDVITVIVTNGNAFFVGGFKSMLKHKREDL